MSEMDKKILHRDIRQDSKILIDEFSSLHRDTRRYLEGIHCSVHELLTCVMDVENDMLASHMPSYAELKTATSVSEIFGELISYGLISFLQFSIVEQVVKELCCDSTAIQYQFQQYKEHFSQYILSRVCSTCVFQEGRFEVFTTTESKHKVDLLIITDDKWDRYSRLVDVLDLEEVVAKHLKIKRFNIQLKSIKPQCLRLCYAISIHVASSVFPLTVEEWKALTSLGIIEMQCQEYHYTLEKKGMPIVNTVSRTNCTKISQNVHRWRNRDTLRGEFQVFFKRYMIQQVNIVMHDIHVTFVECLIQFGEGLGREVGELDKIWENVLGRYDRAVVSLVTDTLQESQNPVEKLVNAVTQMKTPEGVKVVAEAVQKGMTLYFFAKSYFIMLHTFVSSAL